MPKTPLKTYDAVFVSPPGRCPRQGGWGVGPRAHRVVAGIWARGSGAGRGPTATRGRIFIESPRISAVQAEISVHGEPEAQTPHLPCRSHAAGTREAKCARHASSPEIGDE